MENGLTLKRKNKQAIIVKTTNNGIISTINQIVNTGIGIEYDFIKSKNNFKNYELATKWALKQLAN